MKIILSFFLLFETGFLLAREPDFGGVDYSNPAKYLGWPDSLGDRRAIREQAARLKGNSEVATLRNVLNWMERELKYEDKKAYLWRNYDDVVREKAYGGCADQGIVCGVLLKATGIPAVWVETMDVPWIWDFKKGRAFKSWSGHVFLEVRMKDKWMLLDPGGKLLYEDYNPKARILPGNRFAYDKGNDPKEMIMSLQWEAWQRQTEAYFRSLDPCLLPVDATAGTELSSSAYVVGNSPFYQVISRMASEAGFVVRKQFNSDYETLLPQARGHLLLVETHQGTPIVPLPVLEQFFPESAKGLREPDATIKVNKTTIVFLDFAKPLRHLMPGAGE